MEADFKAIDADGHVVEPHGMWHDYIEKPYKNQAPRSVGAFSLIVNDKDIPSIRGRMRELFYALPEL